MHQRYLNERDEAAQKTIVETATILAERLGAPPGLIARFSSVERDPQVSAMMQREAVAELLQSVVAGFEQIEAGDTVIANAMKDKDERITELEKKVAELESNLAPAETVSTPTPNASQTQNRSAKK